MGIVFNRKTKMSKREAGAAVGSPSKAKAAKRAFTLNVNNALDKADELNSFQATLALKPSALQGLAEHADATLAALHIKTIGELGEWKFFTLAWAIVTLAEREEEGKRAEGNQMNINKGLDQDWETKSLKEVAAASVEVLQGIGPKAVENLAKLHIKTVSDLGNWKYAHWAAALIQAAKWENADFSSK